jgi:hypothetical protein
MLRIHELKKLLKFGKNDTKSLFLPSAVKFLSHWKKKNCHQVEKQQLFFFFSEFSFSFIHSFIH